MMYRLSHHLIGALVALALVAGACGANPFVISSALADEATPTVPTEPLGEELPVVEEPLIEGEQPPPEETVEEAEPSGEEPPVTEPGGDDTAHPVAEAAVEAPASSLTYALAGQPVCLPVDGQPEIVVHGGYLDYDCTAGVQLSGAHLAPLAVQLGWTVAVSVDGGWSVQLLPPAVDPNAPSEWTAAGSARAVLAHQSGIGDGAAGDVLETFDATTTLAFGLRAHRVACGTEAQPVTVDVAVAPSLPGVETVTIQDTGIEQEPYELRPALAPIPEPAIAFGGSLDFGEVRVDATGVLEPPAPQTIDITVSGLDQACGDWAVSLNSTTLGGEDGAAIAASTLNLVSIDGKALTDGGCPLADGCEVAVLRAGAEAAPTATFTLGVSLVLPDQPRATTFNSTLTATLMETTS